MFKVGDIITCDKENTIYENTLGYQLIKAEVLSVVDKDAIAIKILEHTQDGYVGREHIVDVKSFKLDKPDRVITI